MNENPTFSHSFPPLSTTDSGYNYFRLHIRQRELQLYYFRLSRHASEEEDDEDQKKKNLKVLPHFRQNVQIPSAIRCSEHWKSFHAAKTRNTKSLEVVKSLTTAAMAEEGSARDTRQQRPFLSLSLSLSLTFLSLCVHCPLIKLKFCPQYCPSLQWNRYYKKKNLLPEFMPLNEEGTFQGRIYQEIEPHSSPECEEPGRASCCSVELVTGKMTGTQKKFRNPKNRSSD